jgi:hypothetical protein
MSYFICTPVAFGDSDFLEVLEDFLCFFNDMAKKQSGFCTGPVDHVPLRGSLIPATTALYRRIGCVLDLSMQLDIPLRPPPLPLHAWTLAGARLPPTRASP